MRLGWFDRTRAGLGAPALRAMLGTPSLRRALAASRSAPVDGQVLDEHLAAMLRLDDISRDSVLLGAEPPEARRRVAASIAIVDARSDLSVVTRELGWTGPGGLHAARLYVPDGCEAPSPGLLYIHGGGWVTGDVDTHDNLCRKLAGHGQVRVLSVDYRLAPEHPFPAAVEDAVAAFRWTVEQAGELGLDPARIGVGGDSAGGNLAAVVGAKCASDRIRPALALLLYPALDATLAEPSHRTFAEGWFLTRPMIDWYYAHYAGHDAGLRHHPDVSPLHADRLHGAPPTLIYPAHFDPLRDEALRYGERLRQAGVPARVTCLETFIHGFALMTGASPAAARAVERIAKELGAALRGGVS